MLFIGVDLGTSSVKLLLMDEEGTVVNTVTKEYPLKFPKTGWAEQDPEDWYAQTVAGIRELVRENDREQVAGLSFGGQMHGLVVLDAEDRVIRPAILWNDGRSQKESQYLNQVIGEDVLAKYTGNISFAGFTASKILWLKKHEPENFHKIKKLMLPKDYLAYRFTGVHATDVSDASGMLLLDVKSRAWSKEMCNICHISESILPALYESYECIGTLTKEAAKDLQLPAFVKVAAGAGDNAAAAIATGTVGDGKCNVSLGTSGTIFISADQFHPVSNHALHSFCDAAGSYHLMGCMLSAASCNKWWMDDILHTKDYEAEQSRISRLGQNKVYYLPYLMGERSPHNDPDVRAAFLNMSMDTTREDMTQAVLEGVAFGLRDSLEIAKEAGITVASTRLCGGGAKSQLWRQIIANVLQIPVEILEQEEGPSLGAAILAAVCCGVFTDVQEGAKHIVKIKEVLTPKDEWMQRYDEKYDTFRKIYPIYRQLDL